MPTLIITSKVTKGYEHWAKSYDSAEELRVSQYGIKTIYRGHDAEDPTTIRVVMNTPTMEALQQHMQNDAELMADAGGDPSPEATTIVVCSD